MDDGRKTPLFEEHKRLGGKIVPFGGWMMPVSYEGTLAEHKTVREACGIFDVSHMGELRVRGREALQFVQHLTVNDASKLGDGCGQYTAMLNEQGGFVDDLILYRITAEDFLLCVNASNKDKDYKWVASHAGRFKVAATDESEQWSQLAVQGPKAPEVLSDILDADGRRRLMALPFTGIMEATLFGKRAFIARTGYTGERGFEVYLPNAIAVETWQALLEKGPRTGLKPIGLGARDTLRLEACYLLYGNDMDDTVTPLEAGIGWAVRLDAGDFIGKPVLEKQKAAGLNRRIFAFNMVDNAIPRHGMEVFAGTEKVGYVTSGSTLPTLGGAGGMLMVDCRRFKEGDTVEVDVRGKRKVARLMKRPLYTARVK